MRASNHDGYLSSTLQYSVLAHVILMKQSSGGVRRKPQMAVSQKIHASKKSTGDEELQDTHYPVVQQTDRVTLARALLRVIRTRTGRELIDYFDLVSF